VLKERKQFGEVVTNSLLEIRREYKWGMGIMENLMDLAEPPFRRAQEKCDVSKVEQQEEEPKKAEASAKGKDQASEAG